MTYDFKQFIIDFQSIEEIQNSVDIKKSSNFIVRKVNISSEPGVVFYFNENLDSLIYMNSTGFLEIEGVDIQKISINENITPFRPQQKIIIDVLYEKI